MNSEITSASHGSSGTVGNLSKSSSSDSDLCSAKIIGFLGALGGKCSGRGKTPYAKRVLKALEKGVPSPYDRGVVKGT